MTHRKADFKNENFKTEQRYQRLNTWGGQKKKIPKERTEKGMKSGQENNIVY